MKYLLDTDVLVDHIRGRVLLDTTLVASGISISVITLCELIHGAHKSQRPTQSVQKIEKTIRELAIEIVEVSQVISYEFGLLKAALEKMGQRLEDFDLLIAATAKMLGMPLVTRNVQHFQSSHGLVFKGPKS